MSNRKFRKKLSTVASNNNNIDSNSKNVQSINSNNTSNGNNGNDMNINTKAKDKDKDKGKGKLLLPDHFLNFLNQLIQDSNLANMQFNAAKIQVEKCRSDMEGYFNKICAKLKLDPDVFALEQDQATGKVYLVPKKDIPENVVQQTPKSDAKPNENNANTSKLTTSKAKSVPMTGKRGKRVAKKLDNKLNGVPSDTANQSSESDTVN